MDFIDRSAWTAVVAAFSSFFAGTGVVVTDDRHVSFAAPSAGTGLTLNRDGTSESFMPLHELGGRWDRVAFNAVDTTVVVAGESFSYTYRVPPSLLHG